MKYFQQGLAFFQRICYNITKRKRLRAKALQARRVQVFKRGADMDKDKEKRPEEKAPADKTWVDDMKQELEDYIEEQGIYIRQ